MQEKLIIFTDGGSRGNPGVAGAGVYIIDQNGQEIHREYRYLGLKTNNEAEYSGLIGALNWININKDMYSIAQVNFHSDSQLMIRQLQGLYKVRAPNLIPIFQQAKELIRQINLPFKFQDVRREFNQLADDLANQAMDQKI